MNRSLTLNVTNRVATLKGYSKVPRNPYKVVRRLEKKGLKPVRKGLFGWFILGKIIQKEISLLFFLFSSAFSRGFSPASKRGLMNVFPWISKKGVKNDGEEENNQTPLTKRLNQKEGDGQHQKDGYPHEIVLHIHAQLIRVKKTHGSVLNVKQSV